MPCIPRINNWFEFVAFCHVFLESSFKKPIIHYFEKFTDERAPIWGFFCVLKGFTHIASELQAYI